MMHDQYLFCGFESSLYILLEVVLPHKIAAQRIRLSISSMSLQPPRYLYSGPYGLYLLYLGSPKG